MRYPAAALLSVCAGTALAACPPTPDRTEELAVLFTEAQQAPNEMAGRAIANRMWALWTEAPDGAAQEMLDRGMRARGAYDYDAAMEAFDALVDYCPDYAEGYNQRAFVNFLRRDFGTALDDLERALELSPTHVAAMSGKALVLMGLGRNRVAQSVLRDALKLNPWLPERRFLIERTPDDAPL